MEKKHRGAIEIREIRDKEYDLFGYVPCIYVLNRGTEINGNRVAISNAFDLGNISSYMMQSLSICSEADEEMRQGGDRDEVLKKLRTRIENLVPETEDETQ